MHTAYGTTLLRTWVQVSAWQIFLNDLAAQSSFNTVSALTVYILNKSFWEWGSNQLVCMGGFSGGFVSWAKTFLRVAEETVYLGQGWSRDGREIQKRRWNGAQRSIFYIFCSFAQDPHQSRPWYCSLGPERKLRNRNSLKGCRLHIFLSSRHMDGACSYINIVATYNRREFPPSRPKASMSPLNSIPWLVKNKKKRESQPISSVSPNYKVMATGLPVQKNIWTEGKQRWHHVLRSFPLVSQVIIWGKLNLDNSFYYALSLSLWVSVLILPFLSRCILVTVHPYQDISFPSRPQKFDIFLSSPPQNGFAKHPFWFPLDTHFLPVVFSWSKWSRGSLLWFMTLQSSFCISGNYLISD